MLKPLLRVNPSLSGNVKLACVLNDYQTSDNINYECNVRGAKLLPLSHSLMLYNISVNLLGSSYEYDLKNFFKKYSDSFYKNENNFSQFEPHILDKTVDNHLRNTDFEMGCKRISYQKFGNDFAFLAPIYIESINDLPSYFLITLKIKNDKFSVTKHLKINILSNDNSKNYLQVYLKKYSTLIDDKVYLNDDLVLNGYYFGIDLKNGGFTKTKDSVVRLLFTTQNTINNFDAILSYGFRRNKIAIRQILPLCYFVDFLSVLSELDKEMYKYASVEISGDYYDVNGNKCPWYDLNTNYDYYYEKLLKSNRNNGRMEYTTTENVMEQDFPSLNERYFKGYEYSNKIAPTFNRWILSYTDETNPYIANTSFGFSKIYKGTATYKEYPSSYDTTTALIDVSQNKTNLIFPFGTSKYDKYGVSKWAENYHTILDRYCLNWFDISFEDNLEQLINTSDCADVKDNKCYYKGVLYEFDTLCDEKNNVIKLDKFGIVFRPHLLKTDDKDIADMVVFKDLGGHFSFRNNGFDVNNNQKDYSVMSNKRVVPNPNGRYANISNVLKNCYYNTNEFVVQLAKIANKLESLRYQSADNKKDVLSICTLYDYDNNNGTLFGARAIELIKQLNNTINKYSANNTTHYELLNVPRISQYFTVNEGVPQTIFDSLFDDDTIDFDKEYNNIFLDILYNGEATQSQSPETCKIYKNGCFTNYDSDNDNEDYITKNMILVKSYFIENTALNSDDFIFEISDFKTEYSKIEQGADIKIVFQQIIKMFEDLLHLINNLSEYKYYPTFFYKNKEIIRNVFIKIEDFYEDNYVYIEPYNLYKLISQDNFKQLYQDYIQNKEIDHTRVLDIYIEEVVSYNSGNTVINTRLLGKNEYFRHNGMIYKCTADMTYISTIEQLETEILKNISIKAAEQLVTEVSEYSYNKFINKDHLYNYCNFHTTSNPLSNVFKRKQILQTESSDNQVFVTLKNEFSNLDLDKLTLSYIDKNLIQSEGSAFYFKDAEEEVFNLYYYGKLFKMNTYLFKKMLDLLPVSLKSDIYNTDLYVYVRENNDDYDGNISIRLNSSDDSKTYSNLSNCFCPLFDSPRFQNVKDTLSYQEWVCGNVIFENENDGSAPIKLNNRNIKCLVECDTDTEVLDRYDVLDYPKYSFYNIDGTKPYSSKNINVVSVNGKTYGMYIVDYYFDNTDQSLNMCTLSMIVPKHIQYVNGLPLFGNIYFNEQWYRNIMPFVKLNVYSIFDKISFKKAPSLYNIKLYYIPSTNANTNGKETTISFRKNRNNNLIIFRYLQELKPLLSETSSIEQLYNIKYKYNSTPILGGGNSKWNDNYTLYPTKLNINTFYGIRVYRNKTEYDLYYPMEYKSFNTSKCIILEPCFSVQIKDAVTYDELLKKETEYQSLCIFKEYVGKFLKKDDNISDEEYKYLFFKYKIKYDSYPIKTKGNEKMYSLKYIFTLL